MITEDDLDEVILFINCMESTESGKYYYLRKEDREKVLHHLREAYKELKELRKANEGTSRK